MTSNIWSDGKTIWGLMGRYISITSCSGQHGYEGVLVSVDQASKTFTLGTKPVADNTANNAYVRDGYKQGNGIQTVPWVQGDNVKIVDLSEEDDFDSLIAEKNSRQFHDNFLLKLARLSKTTTFP